MYIPRKMPTDLKPEEIATKFEGISGSDISNAVLNGAFRAARQKLKYVPANYIKIAFDPKIILDRPLEDIVYDIFKLK